MSRVALVTGGSRGIGRAVCLELTARGHRVAVNYFRSADAAAEVVETVASKGGEAVAVEGDVSREEDAAALFEAVAERLGPVEVLVNNAGITRDQLLVRMAPADWDRVMEVNLRSVYLCSRLAMRGMLRARWGRIVSVSSVAGLVGNPGQTNYAASKAGVIGFTKALAKEVGSRGITVNAVAPGFIETELTAAIPEDARRRTRQLVSLGRWGTPEEVASAVGYLASEDASYVTGQVIVVDGGLSM